MTLNEPLFMENEKWFYFDRENFKYKLTKEAPPQAIKSYQEFYMLLEKV